MILWMLDKTFDAVIVPLLNRLIRTSERKDDQRNLLSALAVKQEVCRVLSLLWEWRSGLQDQIIERAMTRARSAAQEGGR